MSALWCEKGLSDGPRNGRLLSRYHLRHLADLEELSRNEGELAVKVVVLPKR